jgi:D-xylose transport system permease protein
MRDSAVLRARQEGILERTARVIGIDMRMAAMIGALLLIWIVFHLSTDMLFLTPRNLYNLAVQSTVVAIMATGMVLIIVARHIDLSVGSLLGFTGMMIAWIQVEVLPIETGWNWPVSIVAGLIIGGGIGLIQGAIVAYGGVPAFVVTLAGLMIWRGGAWMITEGRTVAPMDTTYQLLGGGIDGSIGEFWSWVLGLVAMAAVVFVSLQARRKRQHYGFDTRPMWAEVLLIGVWIFVIAGFVLVMNSYYKPRTDIPRGIPVPVLILIIVVLAMTFLSRATRFGRYVFAMGGNPEAAELAGIDVKKYTMMIFGLMGVLAAVAAVITTARLNAGANSMGLLAELSVIAAAVIGGTSLSGGIGTVPGAILGAVLMQSLENGMVLLGVPSAMQRMIIGVVLVAAVFFDVLYRRRAAR